MQVTKHKHIIAPETHNIIYEHPKGNMLFEFEVNDKLITEINVYSKDDSAHVLISSVMNNIDSPSELNIKRDYLYVRGNFNHRAILMIHGIDADQLFGYEELRWKLEPYGYHMLEESHKRNVKTELALAVAAAHNNSCAFPYPDRLILYYDKQDSSYFDYPFNEFCMLLYQLAITDGYFMPSTHYMLGMKSK